MEDFTVAIETNTITCNFKAANQKLAEKITEELLALINDRLCEDMELLSSDSTLKIEADVIDAKIYKTSDL
jgi:hypothetical protein